MTTTTNPNFDLNTEATEVAKVFADGIRGKTILVTGVNLGGLGFATVEALSSQSPAHIITAGRNVSKLQACIEVLKAKYPSVNYHPLQVDLGSQKAVRAAAKEVLSWLDLPTIDIVINNAGIMGVPERTLSEDGIELHFATNHIGHFLLTNLIMPKLLKAAELNPARGATRIINISSASPTTAHMRWSDINFDKINKDLPVNEQPAYAVHRFFGETGDLESRSYLPIEGYSQSKVANLLFAIGANKRLYEHHGILSLTVHPGVIFTELTRDIKQETLDAITANAGQGLISFKTAQGGAATGLVAALDLKLGVGEAREGKENYGVYLVDCQISATANQGAESSSEAERLWSLSEDLVSQKFSW